MGEFVADIPLACLDTLIPRLKGRGRQILEALNAGVPLPPITIFARNLRIELSDGNHRLWAHRQLERSTIRVRFLNMDDRWWSRKLGLKLTQ